MARLTMQAATGLDGAMEIDAAARTDNAIAVGTLFTPGATAMSRPTPEPIMKLSMKPNCLQIDHHALYARMYKLQPPKPFDTNFVGWKILMKSTKMRHRASFSQRSGPATPCVAKGGGRPSTAPTAAAAWPSPDSSNNCHARTRRLRRWADAVADPAGPPAIGLIVVNY
eukprot:3484413-Pyramimonas_sp.AAC.2